MKKLSRRVISFFGLTIAICLSLSVIIITDVNKSIDNYIDYLVSDFQVNENAAPLNAEQINSSLTSISSEIYFVVWEDHRTDNQNEQKPNIFGQLVSSTGSKLGDNIQINEINQTHGFCWNPKVYSNDQGYTCVVWTQYRIQQGGMTGRGQLYDSTGNKIGNNFTITSSPFAIDINVNVLNNRKIIASWIDDIYNGPWGYENDLYIKLFDESGDSLTTRVRVNDIQGTVRFSSSLSYDSNGKILVSWDDEMYDCYFQLFNSEGMPINSNIKIDDGTNLSAYSYANFIANNDIVICWWERLDYNYSIYAQIFNNDGTPKNAKFKVNDAGDEFLYAHPVVEATGQNDFIIIWQDKRNGNWDIYAQRYANDGTAIDNNFLINDDATTEDQQFVSIISNANQFALTWQDKRDLRWNYDIYLQRFLLNGQKLDTSQKLNDDFGLDGQSSPDISGDFRGNAIIVWADTRYGKINIYAQRLDSIGQLLGKNINLNSQQNNYDYKHPAISMNESGNFVVVWADNRYDSRYDIYAQRYDKNGIEIGTDIKINDDAISNRQKFPDVALDDIGNFVVVWSDERRENAYSDIYGQRISNNGELLGNNFVVNDDQRNWLFRNYPSTAVNSVGEFVICWQNGATIISQKYNPDGSKFGENLIINDENSGNGFKPEIILNDSGRIVVVWYNTLKDIYTQLFSSNLEKIGSNLKVNDDNNNAFQDHPHISENNNGDYFIVWQDGRESGSVIYGQYFSNTDSKINRNFRVSTNPFDKQLTPKTLITNENIITTWTTIKSAGQGDDIWANMFDYDYIRDTIEPINIDRYFLAQNYPNPFNPATKINYKVPERSFVTLKIYDVLGNEITTLVNEEKPAGSYEFEFSGNGLASGIYFYQLQAGSFVETKKMVLLK